MSAAYSRIHPHISPLLVPLGASSLLENLFQLRNNGVTHVSGAGVAAQVLGEGTVINGVLDGLLNGLGLVGQTQRVTEHHGHRQNGADRVDDALARDVGGGTCAQVSELAALAGQEERADSP